MAYTCPYCGNEGGPVVNKQMSTGGWVLFVVLIIFCLPLCWLPFILDGCKEDVRTCASCNAKIG